MDRYDGQLAKTGGGVIPGRFPAKSAGYSAKLAIVRVPKSSHQAPDQGKYMTEFEQFASYTTHASHHELFRSGDLVGRWAKTYPMLYDEDDLRIAEKQAYKGYHFYEWLAAVLIYHNHGLFSLVEKYQFAAHPKKQVKLDKLVEPEIAQFIRSHPDFGNVQCPDLLVYNPDLSDWFFCEVKGPTDRLHSGQSQFFSALAEMSGKAIKLVNFRHMPQLFLEV